MIELLSLDAILEELVALHAVAIEQNNRPFVCRDRDVEANRAAFWTDVVPASQTQFLEANLPKFS